jgi:hypothetical protein
MKIEVTSWDSWGDEISSEVVDVGNDFDPRSEEGDRSGSDKIHGAIERLLLFPGFKITITIPDGKEWFDYYAKEIAGE